YAGIQWAQATSSSKDVDPENACGLTVAVQRTTVSETDDVRPKAEECDGDLEILSYETSDNAAIAAFTGRADAVSGDCPISDYVANRYDCQLDIVGEMFDAAPYGMAVAKDCDYPHAMVADVHHLIDT